MKIKNFDEYINEGIKDFLKPKSADEIIKLLKGNDNKYIFL